MKNIEKKIGYTFKKKEFLKTALTHSSYTNENGGVHNERLEFLGDSILGFVVTSFLYKEFPDNNEGFLSSRRAALVNAGLLALVGEELELKKNLLHSKSVLNIFTQGRVTVFSDTVEAIIGAIYLDGGVEKVSKFIHTFILDKSDELIKQSCWEDSKTILQEKVQAKLKITPIYNVIKEVGKDHNKLYTVEVLVGKKSIGIGSGNSKKKAEMSAAHNTLKKKIQI